MAKKTGCFTRLVVLTIVVLIGIYIFGTDENDAPTRKPIGDGEPIDIRVTNTMVKKVGKKYRYFFTVRNHDTKTLNGSAEITLLNKQPDTRNGNETFNTTKPMQPDGGSSVYMDIYTAPTGGWGVGSFSYEIVSQRMRVAGGTGAITSEFEDTTLY